MDTNVPNKFTRVIFTFGDGGQLFFNDLRRFGYLKLVSKEEKKNCQNNFGIEPLTPDYILEAFIQGYLRNARLIFKALLLNQKLISGIGNIYADEACFEAGILPTRKVRSYVSSEIKKLLGNAWRRY